MPSLRVHPSPRAQSTRLLLAAALCAEALAFGPSAAAIKSFFNPGAASRPAATPVVSRGPRATPASMAIMEPVSSSSDLDEMMQKYVTERGGQRVIKRILIANNGMAATKTIMSIRNFCYNTFGDERAIKFVVMATPEDLAANAEFIRRADEFVEVPGGSNVNNYANVQLIVDLCISQNVDAVMVGWGHASENPKLGDMLKVRGCARAHAT